MLRIALKRHIPLDENKEDTRNLRNGSPIGKKIISEEIKIILLF